MCYHSLPLLTTPCRGEEVVVEEQHASGWLKLSKDDALVHGTSSYHASSQAMAWMLGDGTALGMGVLLEEVLFRPLF